MGAYLLVLELLGRRRRKQDDKGEGDNKDVDKAFGAAVLYDAGVGASIAGEDSLAL